MSTAPVFIESVGLVAPGLADWKVAIGVLANGHGYVPAEIPRFAPSLLPANERRRATTSGRLAFQSAEEAVQATDIPASEMGAVFASGSGDTEVLDRMCKVLSVAERAVSPTDFHNSVHNAAAGYWSIATGSRLPSTALSAFDSTFAAGLMEAVSTAQAEDIPVLLVAYDMRPPVPLLASRPLSAAFSVALLLTPRRRPGSLMSLSLDTGADIAESPMSNTGLEDLRSGNPAARALPLLQALARRQATRIGIPYFERMLAVETGLC